MHTAESLLERIGKIVGGKTNLTTVELTWLDDYLAFQEQQKQERERRAKENKAWDDWRDSLVT